MAASEDFSHRLFSEDTVTVSEDGPEVSVFLSRDDLNAIKLITELAVSENTTYLSIDSTLIVDMVGREVESIPMGGALPVGEDMYMEDTEGPVLFNFTLNLTSEILSLTFDETVSATSVDPSLLFLLPYENATMLEAISLEGSDVITTDAPVVDILIDQDTLHMIKLRTDLSTNTSNTHLLLEQGAVDICRAPASLSVPMPLKRPWREHKTSSLT